MLLRFDPFRELDRLMDQTRTVPQPLPMDAVKRGDEVVVSFDLPGVKPDDIQLTVERNVLTVRAERAASRQEGDQVLAGERRFGTVVRQLLLGDALDTDRLAADYTDGVLTVTVPAAEEAKPRRVEVGAGGQRSAAITAEARESSSDAA